MTHNAENDAPAYELAFYKANEAVSVRDEVIARVAALVDEATGYSVPYKPSRFMPIDSAFTDALRDALGVEPGHACVIPPGKDHDN